MATPSSAEAALAAFAHANVGVSDDVRNAGWDIIALESTAAGKVVVCEGIAADEVAVFERGGAADEVARTAVDEAAVQARAAADDAAHVAAGEAATHSTQQALPYLFHHPSIPPNDLPSILPLRRQATLA